MNRRRTCLLTGGTGQIGTSILRRIATVQRRAIVLTRDRARAMTTFSGAGLACELDVVEADIGNASELEQCLSRIAARVHDIDTVVHAAAATDGMVGDIEASHQVGWLSLRQIFYAVRHQLSESGHGRVVAIGSVACESAELWNLAYATSKLCMKALIRAIARETLNEGITANSISPSSVDTEFGDRYRKFLAGQRGQTLEEFMKAKLAAMPNRELISPDAVAYLVETLLDCSSSHLTGEDVRIAGISS